MNGDWRCVSVSPPQVVIALSGGEIVYFEMDQVSVLAAAPRAVVKLHGCVYVCCAAHAKTGSYSKTVYVLKIWVPTVPMSLHVSLNI